MTAAEVAERRRQEWEREGHSRFCEECGDCLICYGDEVCAITGGEHVEPAPEPK